MARSVWVSPECMKWPGAYELVLDVRLGPKCMIWTSIGSDWLKLYSVVLMRYLCTVRCLRCKYPFLSFE